MGKFAQPYAISLRRDISRREIGDAPNPALSSMVNVRQPTASGSANIGSLVSIQTVIGDWSGAVVGFDWQWYRMPPGGGGLFIDGATNPTYAPTQTDLGYFLLCVATPYDVNGVRGTPMSSVYIGPVNAQLGQAFLIGTAAAVTNATAKAPLVPIFMIGSAAGVGAAQAKITGYLLGSASQLATAQAALAAHLVGTVADVNNAVLNAPTGYLSGTAAEVANGTGTITQANLFGSAAATETATAVLEAWLQGSAAGTETAQAALAGRLTGSAAGTETAQAVLEAWLQGSAAGVETGALSAPTGYLVGSAAGAGNATGVITSSSILNANVSGAGNAQAVLTGWLIGSGPGTENGVATLAGRLLATAAGVETASIVPPGYIIGSGAGSENGTAVLAGRLTGSAAGSETATSVLAGRLTGSAAESASGTGTITPPATMLLDKLSSTAQSGCNNAHSWGRQLKASYSGPIFWCKRAADNAVVTVAGNTSNTDNAVDGSSVVTVINVGTSSFTLGQTMSFSTFAGTDTVYGIGCYDQSGNGRTATLHSGATGPILWSSGTRSTIGTNSRQYGVQNGLQWMDEYQFATYNNDWSYYNLGIQSSPNNGLVFGCDDSAGYQHGGIYTSKGSSNLDVNFTQSGFYADAPQSGMDNNLHTHGAVYAHTAQNCYTSLDASRTAAQSVSGWNTNGDLGHWANGAYPNNGANNAFYNVGGNCESISFNYQVNTTDEGVISSNQKTFYGF